MYLYLGVLSVGVGLDSRSESQSVDNQEKKASWNPDFG
jgi:hypothetical protein